MVKVRGCDQKTTFRRVAWNPVEDRKLIAYISRYGIWNWTEMSKAAGLLRCGKSCRLRWMNYLKPDIKRGNFTQEEDETIIKLHEQLGNRWSTIASRLPGRTDNEIKNHWHTRLKKRFKNKHLPINTLQDTQTTHIAEANQNEQHETEDLLLHNNDPKASNLEYDCKVTSTSSEVTVDNNLSSSSPDPAAEIYQNQTTEEIINSCDDQIQSFWDQPFTMEGLYMIEGFGATYNTDSTCLWGFEEDKFPCASYNDADDDFLGLLFDVGK